MLEKNPELFLLQSIQCLFKLRSLFLCHVIYLLIQVMADTLTEVLGNLGTWRCMFE